MLNKLNILEDVGHPSFYYFFLSYANFCFCVWFKAPKKYYVYNDIFRYQDEEAEVEEQAEENPADFCTLILMCLRFYTIYHSR